MSGWKRPTPEMVEQFARQTGLTPIPLGEAPDLSTDDFRTAAAMRPRERFEYLKKKIAEQKRT